MDARCNVRLLGGLQVHQAGRLINRFQTQKTGALLAYLAYYSHRAHPRELLAEIFWPGDAPETARHKLRVALSSLRRQLEPPGVPAGAVLAASRAAIQMDPRAVTTDVAAFEAALQSAGSALSAVARARQLAEAVDLYGGELLPGDNSEWVLRERGRLAESYFQGVRQLCRLLEQSGELPRALAYARRAVAADPLSEEAHGDLMRLLAAAGQPSAALRQYRVLEQILKCELGETPGPATRTLAGEIELAALSAHSAQHTAHSGDEAGPLAAPRCALCAVRCVLPDGSLPTGTVTFLLTDLAADPAPDGPIPEALPALQERHQALLCRELGRREGRVVWAGEGAVLAAFGRASDALACAVAGQRAWLGAAGVRRQASDVSESTSTVPTDASSLMPDASERSDVGLRMALHTGEVAVAKGNYGGPAREAVARVLTAAHGGQILCSDATAALLRREMEPGKSDCRLADLGVYRLRGAASGEAPPERLFQVLYPEMPEREFPPPKAEPLHAGHLPLPFTRFFGREEELARLRELLLGNAALGSWLLALGRDNDGPVPHQEPRAKSQEPERSDHGRLVTLTGPGGSGKTRLALEAAGRLAEAFHGAAWFVPLADLSDPARIAEAVRDVMGLPRSAGGDPRDQVATALSGQPSLLVLDNFEHLVSDGAWVVRSLLERAPSLTCLVTSRRRLNLAGERELTVLPLPVPAEALRAPRFGLRVEAPDTERGARSLERLTAVPSVQLFVDRAQAVRPDFQLTPANSAAVALLCHRLEGIPLALELAAARAQVLTPAQMLGRLGQRFDLLVSRERDAAARHRTLRAAVDWSYGLLSPELQRFFARLSVFRGGWTLPAAEQVAARREATALDLLAELREYWLIQAKEEGSELRYGMLETLREYAAERLSPTERAVLQRRHAEYYLALVEAAEPHLQQADPATWLDSLEAEHENLQAALAWGRAAEEPAEGSPPPIEVGLRLAAALAYFWDIRGYIAQGRRCLEELLTVSRGVAPALRAKALYAASVMAYFQGEYPQALIHCEESLSLYRQLRDRAATAMALAFIGRIPLVGRDREDVAETWRQCLSLAREMNDQPLIARFLGYLGVVTHRMGDIERGIELLDESLALYRALRHERGISSILAELAYIYTWRSDYPRATELLEEKLVYSRRLKDRSSIAHVLWNLGSIAAHQGAYQRGVALLEESLALRQEAGQKAGIADSLCALGIAVGYQGDAARARSLLEQGLAVYRELDDPVDVSATLRRLGDLAYDQGDDAAAQALLAESLVVGREIKASWCVGGALYGLARVAQRQGDPRSARQLHGESLAIRQEFGQKRDIAASLEGLAAAITAACEASAPGHAGSVRAERRSKLLKAARLFGAAEALRDAIGAPLHPADRAEWERHVAVLRAALGKAAIAAAWAIGRGMTLEQAIEETIGEMDA